MKELTQLILRYKSFSKIHGYSYQYNYQCYLFTWMTFRHRKKLHQQQTVLLGKANCYRKFLRCEYQYHFVLPQQYHDVSFDFILH